VEDDLRAALRADLAAERPPPLGDVVGAAISRGRRVRRNRRWAAAGAGVAVLAVAAFIAFGAGPRLSPLPAALPPGLPPGSVPSIAAAPAAAVPTRTVTVRNGTQRAEGMQKKATSAAMLHLLTALLPPGRTSHYGVAVGNDLHVQLYYDAGHGPSLLRLQVDRRPTGRPRGPQPKVSVTHVPGDCARDTEVTAAWSDGTTVRLDIATCLASGGRTAPPAKAQLSEAEAALIVGDRRWGVAMDAGLVDQSARAFPSPLPVYTR